MSLHISSHLWPKEMVGKDLFCLLGAEMADESSCVGFLHKQNSNRGIWITEFVSSKQKPIMHMKVFPSFAISTLGKWFSKI